MGERVTTLEDLLRPGLRAACVGINPAPPSVEAGHYYQGQLGQRFFGRLRRVGLLPERIEGYEDDALFTAGVGFTDIIKRPTAGAGELRAEEYEHGQEELRRKLHAAEPGIVIFTFKKTAEVLFGGFDGAGFLARTDDPWDWFVMPSPYAARERVDSVLDQLQEHRSVSSGQEGGVRVG